MHNEARLAVAYLTANGTLSESNEQENYAGPLGMLTSRNEQDQRGVRDWARGREMSGRG